MRNEFCILDMSLFHINISVLVFLRRWNINTSIEQVLFCLKLAENKPCFYKIDSINVFLILFHSSIIGCPKLDVSMVYSCLRTWIINSDSIEKRYFPFQRVIVSGIFGICSTYQIVLLNLDKITMSLLMLF